MADTAYLLNGNSVKLRDMGGATTTYAEEVAIREISLVADSERDIPEEYRAIAQAALLPAAGFSDEQRHWLSRWWLACTQADVDAINALLPVHTQVAATEIGGALYLGGDLLTDSLTPAGTYWPARDVLHRLVCTYIEPVL